MLLDGRLVLFLSGCALDPLRVRVLLCGRTLDESTNGSSNFHVTKCSHAVLVCWIFDPPVFFDLVGG